MAKPRKASAVSGAVICAVYQLARGVLLRAVVARESEEAAAPPGVAVAAIAACAQCAALI
eukprot:CAMPEP_0114278204 /NCGR_PEP_ID=MMETSP0059-20121206/1210_1 /TAXON_ID=36894 /ORGANISM="Pyramimonas parkeae, Strain CCMP726" /LENGTH=59 /DNA_ID=CAMNT_0001398383 /DNA_START=1756 /DNA_END=1935 /DNA_ORIENTATION=-